MPNSSDGLIFVKRRALDGPFLDKNTGFRRAKFTFLIFIFLSKFAKKVKIEQNLFFSNAGQGGHHKIKCMEILRRPKLHLNVRRSSQAGSQWWIPSERAQNHIWTGKITKIRALDGLFSPNARLDGRARP